MAMDSSWYHGYATDNTAVGNNGFMCGYAASCIPAESLLHKEEDEDELLISSQQIQHHLNQISMHMNMDDDEVVYDGALVDGLFDTHPGSSFPSSSSSSSLSLRSASLSCSPESSAHILGGAPALAGAGQYPEVSSHVPPLPPPVAPYTNVHAPTTPAAAKKSGAFKRFARHLGPRRPPKPGACGQRMFKTALSVLSKMHVAASARYSQQQQYYYQQQASAEAAPPPSVNQLQHMISERKRREKLNDSFHALRAVLPPGAKKDKTSILIRAREYIKSLESRASELEEKNMSLESRLAQRGDSDDATGRRQHGGEDADSVEKVQVEITRGPVEPRDLWTLKIVTRSGCNTTDVVLRTLQCLREQVGDDVALVSMDTSGSAGGSPRQMGSSSSPRAVLTMQIKSSPGAKWEEQPVKDAVAKVVAETTTAASDQRQ